MIPALMTFAVSVAYVPLPSYATAGRWAMIAAFLIVAVWRISPRMTFGHLAGLAFLMWCIASFFWSYAPLDTINECFHLMLLAGVFLVASCERDLRRVTAALCMALLVSDLIAIGQMNGLNLVNQMGNPAGLFLNKDYFAQIAVPATILAIGYRMWAYVPAAAFGIVVTDSRLALIAAIAGALVLMRRWPAFFIAFTAGLASAAAFVYFDSEDAARLISLNDRLAFWQVTAANLSWVGYGFGSYPSLFPLWEHAHNEFLEVAFEVGVIGAGLLIAVFAYALRSSDDVARAAFVSLLVCCLGSFPLHLPTTAYLAALLAGYLCADPRRIRMAQSVRRVSSAIGPRHFGLTGVTAIRTSTASGDDVSFRPQSTPRTGNISA